MFIFLYIAAAALATGSVITLKEAQKAQARADAKHLREFEKEMLEGEIAIRDLRKRAEELGIDSAEAVRGYKALQEGTISISEVMKALGNT